MHISVTGGDSDTRVLVVAGELDMAAAPHVHTAAATALRDDHVRRLVIDFADVTFLDCAGIAALLEVSRRARARGADAVLVHPRPLVQRVLEATGVAERLMG
ncbi:STAS domain-containing protein [Actinoplanes sp. HUAS TT8]|uniref:STAS domain-containing protein n=1 Tax=Actinoplanes sp. HUAS TT8 TaxID=3447453 RepID=UPI003F51BEB1